MTPHPHLHGHSILIVADEPVIAIDIASAFEDAGASVLVGLSVKEAKPLVVCQEISAAILDHALADGSSEELCDRLLERDIPFLIYSGYPVLSGPCRDAPHLLKPASTEQIVKAMEELLEQATV
jgi:DNA-binding NtrC family response regulator